MIDNKALALQDKEAYEILQKERRREEDNIELIASENFVSMAVREANGSIFTNKYAEGYPGRRYYGGCEYIDRMEVLAIERLKKLFNCQYANVQPHSGSSANMEVYQALLNHGDRILGMSLDAGGHLTHGYRFSFSGKEYESYSYGVDEKTGLIDYDNVLKIAREVKPKMIICGASAYPRIIDFKKFREIADDVGALLPCLLDDLALGDDGFGVQLGLTHHFFHFFFGAGHIVVAGGDQFLGLFQLQRQLGADLVQDIQCFVPVDGAFFGVESNAFGLVDHVIQHVDQTLYVLFFHVSGHILSSIPPQPVRVHIFQGAGDTGSSPAPWWS